MLTLLWELIRKDLKVFMADRRAVIISCIVPVAIASLMGAMTQNMSGGGDGNAAAPASKIKVAVVDEDKSPVTTKILANLKESKGIEPQVMDRTAAEKMVADGSVPEMIVFTKGFGEQSLSPGQVKAKLVTRGDPSKKSDTAAASGMIIDPIIAGIVSSKYGVNAPTVPFETVDETPKPADPSENWSGVGHAFAGMGVQGLLFWAIESAMGILRERRQGIWRRLRASPVSPAMLMLAKVLSGALRAFVILGIVLGAGALLFHMRVEGSWLGFLLVCATVSLMAATFGLFVAALGKTEQQSRGLSILAVLGMVMLGGAWFPSFLLPGWIQTLSRAMPVKWAVDGLDATTWRGQDFASALPCILALLGFAFLFATIALRRIRWDYEA